MYIEPMTLKNDKKEKAYTFEQAFKSALEYFKGDELAAKSMG
jgi:hypothetical protein